MKKIFKNIFRKKTKSINSNYNKNIVCDICGWQGTFEESMQSQKDNDKCPICSNDKLSYIINP